MFTRVPGPNDIMNNTVGETSVEGRIIPVGRGGEAIVFEIHMGFFKIVAIANIPEEGAEKAPVYLKLKVGDFAYQRAQSAQARANSRRAARQTQYSGNGNGHGSDVDDGDYEGDDSHSS
jgi:hypothetical protein